MADRVMLRVTAVTLCLLLGGCASAHVDTSVLPAGMYGTGDQDDAAIYDAVTFFRGRNAHSATPQQAARVLAVVEYLGGEVYTNDRFSGLNGTEQVQMLQARDEVRHALGVAAVAHSQQIVTALLAVSSATDPAAQMAALATPIFTLGPQATFARLTALPPMPITRRALDQIWNHEYRKLDAV